MVTIVWGRARERQVALGQELERIARVLPALPGVESAWVFGSTVQDGVHGGSDLDLLVVRRTAEPFLERALTLLRELAPRVPVDLFVYTPAELEAGGRFIRHALETGRPLW